MELKEKSTEKLKGEAKALKMILIALIIVLGLQIVISIYGFLTKEDNKVFFILGVVPLTLSPMIFVLWYNMKKIKDELKSR